ncbi:hypothetical protein CEXT_584551 [Caerostris extrusa]|uniref:Uncharacterized protein n=1 Tax=Caerostris extrusa TaxID=172846 RepID=A0AAV4U719_CAEEX|nr:hypothetical protein CEXT_584551 [Caerostris extrusa]
MTILDGRSSPRSPFKGSLDGNVPPPQSSCNPRGIERGRLNGSGIARVLLLLNQLFLMGSEEWYQQKKLLDGNGPLPPTPGQTPCKNIMEVELLCVVNITQPFVSSSRGILSVVQCGDKKKVSVIETKEVLLKRK